MADESAIKWAARRLLEEYRDQACGNIEPWDTTLERVLSRTPKAIAQIVADAVYGEDRERLIDVRARE